MVNELHIYANRRCVGGITLFAFIQIILWLSKGKALEVQFKISGKVRNR